MRSGFAAQACTRAVTSVQGRGSSAPRVDAVLVLTEEASWVTNVAFLGLSLRTHTDEAPLVVPLTAAL